MEMEAAEGGSKSAEIVELGEDMGKASLHGVEGEKAAQQVEGEIEREQSGKKQSITNGQVVDGGDSGSKAGVLEGPIRSSTAPPFTPLADTRSQAVSDFHVIKENATVAEDEFLPVKAKSARSYDSQMGATKLVSKKASLLLGMSKTDIQTEQGIIPKKKVSAKALKMLGTTELDAQNSWDLEAQAIQMQIARGVSSDAVLLKSSAGPVDPLIQQPFEEKTIKQYKVIGLLGTGSQGTVSKVVDMETMVVYAMKTVHNVSLRKKSKRRYKFNDSAKTLEAEIALMKKVDHKNLVNLYEVIDAPEDKDVHLVLEYVAGGTLTQLSDKRLINGSAVPLNEEKSRIYFRQLIEAISYLHHNGIIHRDIKPSNVLVDPQTDHLKVCDFGISTLCHTDKAKKFLGADDQLIAAWGVPGTPAFLPPEYYKIITYSGGGMEDDESDCDLDDSGMDLGDSHGEGSEKNLKNSRRGKKDKKKKRQSYKPEKDEHELPVYHGRPADVWATGVTLYAFVYGALPFSPTPPGTSFSKKSKAPSMVYMQDQIMHADLKFPGIGLGVSSKLRSLLYSMLEKDPKKRTTLADIASHAWVTKNSEMGAVQKINTPKINVSQGDEDRAISSMPKMVRSFARKARQTRSRAHILSSKARASLLTNDSQAEVGD